VPEHDLPDFEMAPPHVLNGMTSPLLLHLEQFSVGCGTVRE
jgi:hypothetical protein